MGILLFGNCILYQGPFMILNLRGLMITHWLISLYTGFISLLNFLASLNKVLVVLIESFRTLLWAQPKLLISLFGVFSIRLKSVLFHLLYDSFLLHSIFLLLLLPTFIVQSIECFHVLLSLLLVNHSPINIHWWPLLGKVCCRRHILVSEFYLGIGLLLTFRSILIGLLWDHQGFLLTSHISRVRASKTLSF